MGLFISCSVNLTKNPFRTYAFAGSSITVALALIQGNLGYRASNHIVSIQRIDLDEEDLHALRAAGTIILGATQ